jgi:ferredoxin-type protein NapH
MSRIPIRKFITRPFVQLYSAIALNSNVQGFFNGKIWRGTSKTACIPVLNCYSCPGATASCPIGSLQAVINDRKFDFSFYVVGFLILVGTLVGRLFCGWMCPFGWFQDLIHKIPLKKITLPRKIVKILSLGKYIVLLVFVFFLPLVLLNEFGIGKPWFCEFICPAGTLQAGLPLILLNKELFDALGLLFTWKFSLLLITVYFSIKILRPFCRFICPLGAFYAFFQRVSLYSLQVDSKACTHCGVCNQACGLNLQPETDPNDPECIRCGDCIKACPTRALTGGFKQRLRVEIPLQSKTSD